MCLWYVFLLLTQTTMLPQFLHFFNPIESHCMSFLTGIHLLSYNANAMRLCMCCTTFWFITLFSCIQIYFHELVFWHNWGSNPELQVPWICTLPAKVFKMLSMFIIVSLFSVDVMMQTYFGYSNSTCTRRSSDRWWRIEW